MFDNFKIYKLKSKIEKYEVEDLYLKREREVPIDLVEDIEKQMEKVEKKANQKRRYKTKQHSTNNPLSVIKSIIQEVDHMPSD